MNKSIDNGNIAYMAQNLAPSSIDPQTGFHPFDLGSYRIGVYQYDQLNRIKQSKSGFYENEVLTMGNKYFSNYSYDANGNITHLYRRDQAANLFDDFVYNYNTNNTGLQNNKLRSVNDVNSAVDGQYNDITAGQSIDNYEYDEIGNLIADESEEIYKIHWTVYGKVAAVERVPTSSKPDIMYFYDAMGNRVAKTVLNKMPNPYIQGQFIDDPNDEQTTVYIRDASGNVMATYQIETDENTPENEINFNPKVEYTLYGSSRLGVAKIDIDEQIANNSNNFANFTRQTGNKMYELSNHLGNVGVVISDKRLGKPATTGSLTASYYNADVLNATDNFAFGMPMPGRSYTSENYRFGFNGQEKDNDISGTDGGHLVFTYRIHDARLGRFLSVDPLYASYPWNSPYAFAENDVVRSIDLEGLEKYFANDGSFIGSVGKSPQIRVLNSEEDVSAFISNQAGVSNARFSSNLLTKLKNPELQSKVLTSIYNKEIASRNTSEGNEYDLFNNKIFIKGKGLEGFISDKGNSMNFSSGTANSYFSNEKSTGIINFNSLTDNYYDLAKQILHENNHNLQTKKGIDTHHPINHFDVEYSAYKVFKNNISNDEIDFTKQLLQGYLSKAKNMLDEIELNEGKTSQYKQQFSEFKKREKLYDKEFSNSNKQK